MFPQECEYDSVEVASKLGDDILRKHGVFCGSRVPQLLTSEGNSMRVTFTSDNRLIFCIDDFSILRLVREKIHFFFTKFGALRLRETRVHSVFSRLI